MHNQRLLARIDHLVYTVPDLEAGVQYVHELLGVRPQEGGRHPSWGTHNALLSLGPTSYLEIVAPDPARDPTAHPPPFALESTNGPRLTTWAARPGDLGRTVSRAAEAGFTWGPVVDGSRRTPDGSTLTWRLTDPRVPVYDGVVPFLIDWGGTPHPGGTAPRGGTIRELRGRHPKPEAARHALRLIECSYRLEWGVEPELVATIETVSGREVHLC